MMLGLVVTLLLVGAGQAQTGKVLKETFGSGGTTRTYYLFVPEEMPHEDGAPLLILLHGSGRNGRSLLDHWIPLARKAGIVLAAPDSVNSAVWSVPEDGPDFLRHLTELLVAQHDIDPRRVYLFGHSAGGGHALAMATFQPRYFAAAAAHAGVLGANMIPMLDRASRRIPVAMWIGTRDALVPLEAARATRDAFTARGFEVEFTEMAGHTHAYYDRSAAINAAVWRFLERIRLDGEPYYQTYQFTR